MARKKEVSERLRILHGKLKESIKQTALDIKKGEQKYLRELADYERLYGKYEQE